MVGFHAQVGQGEKRGTISSVGDRRGGFWPCAPSSNSASSDTIAFETDKRTRSSEKLLMRAFKTEDFTLWLLRLCQKPRYHEIMNVPVSFKCRGSSLLTQGPIESKLIEFQFFYCNGLFRGVTTSFVSADQCLSLYSLCVISPSCLCTDLLCSESPPFPSTWLILFFQSSNQGLSSMKPLLVVQPLVP